MDALTVDSPTPVVKPEACPRGSNWSVANGKDEDAVEVEDGGAVDETLSRCLDINRMA